MRFAPQSVHAMRQGYHLDSRTRTRGARSAPSETLSYSRRRLYAGTTAVDLHVAKAQCRSRAMKQLPHRYRQPQCCWNWHRSYLMCRLFFACYLLDYFFVRIDLTLTLTLISIFFGVRVAVNEHYRYITLHSHDDINRMSRISHTNYIHP